MKKPSKAAAAAGGKKTKAKDKSGVNAPVTKAKVPNVKASTTYGRPSQTQKM